MWAQGINAALGIWLMAAPDLLGFGKKIADNGHIVGPIVATFAITAIFESTRIVRKWNIPCGIWLLLAPWILHYQNPAATIHDMVAGGLVLGLSLVKGKIKNRFGGGWPGLWQANSLHEWEAKHD